MRALKSMLWGGVAWSLCATVSANCLVFCEPQQLQSASVLTPNLEDGYPLKLCLDKPLGRRDRLYPKIELKNDDQEELSVEFILTRFSGEPKAEQCFTRDLLSNISDLSNEELERWMIDFAPERLDAITVTMRDKAIISGDFETYQVYEGH